MKFAPGNIIEVNTVVLKGKRFKVVEDWSDGEPKRVLATDLDGNCLMQIFLAQDCTLVDVGEPYKFKRRDTKPIEGRPLVATNFRESC